MSRNSIDIHIGHLSTPELIQKIQRRDSTILNCLFSEMNPVFFRMLFSHKIFKPQAEDIIHQVWEQFFNKIQHFEGKSHLSTFLCGILINKIREFRRSDKKLVLEENLDTLIDEQFLSDGHWKNMPDDPQSLIESKELGQFIEECIEGLTLQQRTAFVLQEVEDESSENICNVLDVNVSHLRVLIFRAKEKLKKCLQGKVEYS